MPSSKENVSLLISDSHRENRIAAWQSIASCQFIRADKWASSELPLTLGRFAKERPDIIFIADKMKNECALDAVRIIQKIDPQCFIVCMMDEYHPGRKTQLLDAGAIGIIQKPFSQLYIHQVVAAFLEYRKGLWALSEKEFSEKLPRIQDVYRTVLTHLEIEARQARPDLLTVR